MTSAHATSPGPATGGADAKRLLRLIGIGAVIGLPAAAISVALLGIVHQLEHWLWHVLPGDLGYDDAPWFFVLGLPVVGAVIVLFARMLPGDGGHDPSEGLVMEPMPFKDIPGVALAAIGTLAFGAVLGPEGPLVALGSAVAVFFAGLFRRGEQETKVLATAGSASAISALFGGPLPAGALLTEASAAKALGAMQTVVLLPAFVSAAIGYMIFVGVGGWSGVDTFELSVPGLPTYDQAELGDLLVSVAVAIVATVIIVLIRASATRFVTGGRRGLSTPVLLLGGAVLVGLIGLAADGLGASSQDVFFSGQAALPDLTVENSVKILLVLLVAKAVAYLICLSCGFRGGAIFPAIFIAIGVAQFAVIWWDVSPTLAVTVGTAVGMVASSRLVLAGILMAALLGGTAGLEAIPAAVIGAVASWLTATFLINRLAPATAAPAPAADTPTG